MDLPALKQHGRNMKKAKAKRQTAKALLLVGSKHTRDPAQPRLLPFNLTANSPQQYPLQVRLLFNMHDAAVTCHASRKAIEPPIKERPARKREQKRKRKSTASARQSMDEGGGDLREEAIRELDGEDPTHGGMGAVDEDKGEES